MSRNQNMAFKPNKKDKVLTRQFDRLLKIEEINRAKNDNKIVAFDDLVDPIAYFDAVMGRNK